MDEEQPAVSGSSALAFIKRPKVLIGAGSIYVLAMLAGWAWTRPDSSDLPPDAVVTATDLVAAPDSALIHKAFSGVRLRLEATPSSLTRWRDLPEAARHVLVLSCIEENFVGFAKALRRQQSGPFRIEVGEFADAYRAIGGSEAAAIIDALGARSLVQPITDPGEAQAIAELEARLAERRIKDDVYGLLRAYIRAHAAEIGSASP